MKTAGVVLATNTETDRAFDAGVLAVLLGSLCVLALLYSASILTFSEFVTWALLGVPAVVFLSSILFARWLGYADEARYRSLTYSMRLNDLSDE